MSIWVGDLWQLMSAIISIILSSSLTLFVPGAGKSPPLSYFNMAPKLNKSFALMHPDFE